MDYPAYCEMFYAAHYLPIAVYAGGSFLCSSGFYEEGDPYHFVLPKLQTMGTPAVYVSSDTGYYGLSAVVMEGTALFWVPPIPLLLLTDLSDLT